MMRRWMLGGLAALGLLGGGGPAAAQTVEVELPTGFTIVEDRLAVTFADTVAEADARALMAGLRLSVTAAHFYAVLVGGYREAPLTEAEQRALQAAPGFEHVEVIDQEAAWAALPDSLRPTARYNGPRYRYVLRFAPSVAEAAARAAARSLQGLYVAQVTKRPNELVVSTEGLDPEALLPRLEALPAVRYVAYVDATAGEPDSQ